jgi:DNA-binding transcriptional MocR family regulator
MNVTKYQALADDLALAIGNGKLSPNARLPSVRELMQQHQLSLATVTKSLYVLEQLGLIEPRNKAGFYVKETKRLTNVTSVANLSATADGPLDAMCSWRPAVDLFPEKRWQSLLGSIVRRHPFLATRHTEAFGHPHLRAELARRSAENGCFLKEDELIVTQGATEALLLALRATTEAGDRVMVQSPVGTLFARLLETFSLVAVPIQSRVDEAGFVGEIQKILEEINPPKVLLLVANYHFPTGALMPLMAKRNLIRLTEKQSLTIIEDDVYGDLQHEGARPLTLKSFDLSGNVIYVNSCSKSLAPGLRIGWLASGRWRSRIEYFKTASASGVSELSQLVLAEFLAQGSHVPHLRKIRKQLKDRAGEYLALLRLVLGKDVEISAVLGGYSFWLALPQAVNPEEIRSQIQIFWPLLDSTDAPQIVVVSQGLCFNTSVPLTDQLRQTLTAFCFHLRGYL